MSFQNNTNTDILIAGAFAAFTIDLLVYPLDTIKTRIQAPNFKHRFTNVATGRFNPSLFRGLYQGIGSVILATVPSSGAFFTSYEATKSLLVSTPLPLPIAHALASATGELVSCTILTPAEVLKQNAQMVSSRHPPQPSPSKSVPKTKIFDNNATVIAIRKFSSPSQLWRGYVALAGRNLPFTAMQFPLFENLRSRVFDWREQRSKKTGTMWERGAVTAVSAGTSGALAAVVTTPIDVVKTRIMLAASDAQGQDEVKKQGLNVEKEREKINQLKAREGKAGGWAVGKEVLRTEGVKGLFRGGALRGVWTALGSGLYLGVYESGRRFLEEKRVREGDSV